MASSEKSAGDGAAPGSVAQLAPQTGPNAGPATASPLQHLGTVAVCIEAQLHAIKYLAEHMLQGAESTDTVCCGESILACVEKAQDRLQLAEDELSRLRRSFEAKEPAPSAYEWRFTPSGRRISMSHEAACQVEELAEFIADKLHRSGESGLLSIAVRMRQLARVAVSALGDEEGDEARMHHDLFGRTLRLAGEEGRHG